MAENADVLEVLEEGITSGRIDSYTTTIRIRVPKDEYASEVEFQTAMKLAIKHMQAPIRSALYEINIDDKIDYSGAIYKPKS